MLGRKVEQDKGIQRQRNNAEKKKTHFDRSKTFNSSCNVLQDKLVKRGLMT